MGCYHCFNKLQTPSTFINSDEIADLPDTIEILDSIGQGQYGTVHRGISKEHGSIAVKCIHLEQLTKTPRMIAREVSILQRTQHPNIVKYHGCYKDKEFFYITMEICEGGNLREAIDENHHLEESVVRPIMKQMLTALAYLHSLSIVHRDIKPENILFTSERQAKLADFGLSRKILEQKGLTIVGTPFYIAPEMHSTSYTSKCDLWSIGIVLYFATVGCMPFSGNNVEEVFNQAHTAEITKWGLLSPECIDFIRNLTKKVPAERLTAEAALEHPWIQGQPLI